MREPAFSAAGWIGVCCGVLAGVSEVDVDVEQELFCLVNGNGVLFDGGEKRDTHFPRDNAAEGESGRTDSPGRITGRVSLRSEALPRRNCGISQWK